MIVKSVVLACHPERAFALFHEHAGLWWPAERRHTQDAASEIRIEASGRFFERASDGTEAELGVVRQFEPARRLVLDWYPGTGSANPTQVEIRFEAFGAGTRVTVRHGPGAAGADVFGRN
ncbi:MAG TPA: SRPBCC domain-containing protein, partial [Caldimonas sp.]